MNNVNRQYKDRLFRSLFAAEENRGELLALYNALNDSRYQDPTQLIITTIEDVIYMGMKNDLSYLIDSYMVLYEHQSTYNPNMPVRGLIYFGKLYEKYISVRGLSLYKRTVTKLPTPRYYVFYNGTEEKADRIQLKLSDSFIHPLTDGSFEWTAEMININAGHNSRLMKASRLLNEYSEFIELVRETQRTHAGMEIEQVVELAVEESIRRGILQTFLQRHKAEVIGMCITEYDEEKTMNAIREEGFEEGERTTLIRTAKAFYGIGQKIDVIAKALEVPEETVKEWLAQS